MTALPGDRGVAYVLMDATATIDRVAV